jgi:hypothetical protein
MVCFSPLSTLLVPLLTNILHKTDSSALASLHHHSHIRALDSTNIRFAQTRRKTHLSSQSGSRAAKNTSAGSNAFSTWFFSRFYLLIYVKMLFLTPLSGCFCYSEHPSASRLLRHIDAGFLQKVLNDMLCWFPLCHTSFTIHHALCRSHYLIQEFDKNVCQKPRLGPSRARAKP